MYVEPKSQNAVKSKYNTFVCLPRLESTSNFWFRSSSVFNLVAFFFFLHQICHLLFSCQKMTEKKAF